MGNVIGFWCVLLLLAAALVGPGYGLLHEPVMGPFWLLSGVVFGVAAAFTIWGVTLNGFDTYMEWLMVFTLPLSLALCGFSVFCVGALVWRGLGVHVDVQVS